MIETNSRMLCDICYCEITKKNRPVNVIMTLKRIVAYCVGFQYDEYLKVHVCARCYNDLVKFMEEHRGQK